MKDDRLTPQQEKFLKLIYSYVNEEGVFPSNPWLENKLNICKSGVSNLKSRLVAKGFLEYREGHLRLSNKARQFFESEADLAGRREFFSAYVPLLGEIRAGRANAEELQTFAGDFGDFSTHTIPIPALLDSGAKIAAFRVVGDSMSDEGILDGDYVIVELRSDVKSLENKLIATRYLLLEDDLQDTDTIDLSSLPLRGFTLKRFKGTETDKQGNVYYILSRKEKDTREYRHEIKTRIIHPIGQVVGIYRIIK